MTGNEGNNETGHEPELDIRLTISEKASQQISSGEVSDQVLVIIKKIAKDYIDEYAATDTSRELGGVLIGSYEETGSRYIVNISAAIKARYTDATLAEIKFTHQTWEDIDKVKESYYPDEKIIGWFHTHPGFGIFLSDYDLFIQNNFFKFPHQVAYVVDPIKGKSGFFGNVEGTIKRIKYQIEEPKASTVRSRSKVSAYSKKKKKPWFIIFRLLIAATLLLFVLYAAYKLGLEPESFLIDANNQLKADNVELRREIEESQKKIDELILKLKSAQAYELQPIENNMETIDSSGQEGNTEEFADLPAAEQNETNQDDVERE